MKKKKKNRIDAEFQADGGENENFCAGDAGCSVHAYYLEIDNSDPDADFVFGTVCQARGGVLLYEDFTGAGSTFNDVSYFGCWWWWVVFLAASCSCGWLHTSVDCSFVNCRRCCGLSLSFVACAVGVGVCCTPSFEWDDTPGDRRVRTTAACSRTGPHNQMPDVSGLRPNS